LDYEATTGDEHGGGIDGGVVEVDFFDKAAAS